MKPVKKLLKIFVDFIRLLRILFYDNNKYRSYVNFCCHVRGLKEYTFGNINKNSFRAIE